MQCIDILQHHMCKNSKDFELYISGSMVLQSFLSLQLLEII